jgi:nucleotide-binding universal stress UspA family protein
MRVQFRRIICATDFSDNSNRTIAYGVAIAREYGAKLYACHVIDLTGVAIYGEFQLDPVGQQIRVRQEAQAQLGEILAPHGIDWEPLITVGQPAAEIARIVEEKEIDLVISATRGHSGLKRLLLGSVTARLMRTLACPLLAVPGPEPAAGSLGAAGIGFKKVLIGCDFSQDSLLALDYGLSLAQEFQSELHLVHVIEPAAYYDLLKAPEDGAEPVPPVPVDVFAAKLQDLVSKEAKNWCALHTAVLRGRPYEELVTYAAARKIDLIVLGVRGYGLVRSLLMGSTTDRVVRRAPCPVLSVSSQIQDAGAPPASRPPGG